MHGGHFVFLPTVEGATTTTAAIAGEAAWQRAALALRFRRVRAGALRYTRICGEQMKYTAPKRVGATSTERGLKIGRACKCTGSNNVETVN